MNTSNNNNSDINSNNTPKKNINNKKINQFLLFICLKQCFNRLIKYFEVFISKFSLTSQVLFFSIPFSLILYITIFLASYFCYERMFKFDYYNTLKNEYLDKLINDADDAHLAISMSNIKKEVENIDNLFFFQIYLKELISMGLLDDDPSVKIFPNIAKNSENIHEYIDSIQNEYKLNSIYTIPQKEAEENIDNRPDHFSEIGKIYYNFLPLLTYESFLKEIYINETYLIAYEFNNTKNILGEEFYFSFPKLKTELDNTNFFIPTNGLLSPHIVKSKVNFGEKIDDSFYQENWFIKQDYEFRENANDINCNQFLFASLNYNYHGKLNKSNVITLQNYYNINNKNYIINIIYFLNEKMLSDGNLYHSIFLLFNDSIYMKESEKYSDNNTYLVFKSNFLEFSLASKLKEYFYYGMQNINNNFFKNGVSFDGFDLEKLGEPTKYFKSTENFNTDLRYFSALYLFALLFKNLEYSEKKEEFKDILQLQFNKSENIYENICKEYDFSLYIKYLNRENINCWDDKTLLYYSQTTSEQDKVDKVAREYISKPYCICLPLFCLKNNNKNINLNNIEFVDQMNLPQLCQNNYKSYLNNIEEVFKSHEPEYNPELSINYRLNNMKLFSEDITDILEDEYYAFNRVEINQFYGISMMVVTLVNAIDLKSLISSFIEFIDYVKAYYLLYLLIGFFLAFLISNFFLYRRIRKISDIIFDYKKIHDNFLNKLNETSIEKKEKTENIQKDNDVLNKLKRKKSVNLEHNPLIKINKENNNQNNNKNINNILHMNENPLLEELIKLFYNYYKIAKYDLSDMKSNILVDEENELYQILKNISIYSPKFKLEVSMDYNFYNNTKLNQNFLKSIPKNVKIKNQKIMLTQSVVYELLSTEFIEDCGLITNIYFKYLTNINLYSKEENNSIKSSLFDCLMPAENDEESYFNNDNQLIDDSNKNLYIIRREENQMLDEIVNNIENDDYLKKEKLIACFDSFLVNVYYKYLIKISKINY